MTDQTADEARESLRAMAFDLATGGGLVEPRAFDAALDAYRDALLAAAPAVQAPAADHTAPPRLSPQQRDRLWDAIADHGPTPPTFTQQHEEVCRVVAAIIDDHTAVLPAPTGRAAVLREAADRAEIVALRLRLKHDYGAANGAYEVMTELRRMADEAQPAEARPATTEWTFEACYDAENDKWHGVGGTYTNCDQARADFENLKRTDAANRLTHYSPRLKVRLVRATTTYVVEVERTPAAGALQDGARS
ncbi:hypothetical protein ACIP25_11470 [Streptomyces massasporeus]|uniref:hypothetical protein n=1 Tax=Streptomyces massasporeus TaxID=67324 RepID=UPI00382CAC1F